MKPSKGNLAILILSNDLTFGKSSLREESLDGKKADVKLSFKDYNST